MTVSLMNFSQMILATLATNATSLLLALAIVLLLVLVVVVLRTGNTLRRMSYPVYDYTLHKAESEAEKTIKDARSQARNIIAQAEQESSHFLQERRREADEYASRYQRELEEMTANSKKRIEHHHAALEEAYRALGEAVTQEVVKIEAFAKEQTEQALRSFTEELKGRFEGELTSVKSAVEAYREAHLRLIDSRIIALVEHTASLVLQKEFTVHEHADSVYRALEEARRQGIFS